MKKIEIIPAKIRAEGGEEKQKTRKAAAYARVSTDKEEQTTSYESQVEYYTNYINNHPDMELVGIYTDEGISATTTAGRKGFKSMIKDALDGKIDLIITKSISRFARNTVDSLVNIRKLKDAGCEVYFEKENIFTFDSKGELLITIMSSLAQEESRSISENVTWGTRKRFSDGKYSIHYSEFIGYEPGPNGEPVINKFEASVVRRIYYMFLYGMSPYSIAKQLSTEGIKTPMGKDKWSYSVIKSILKNERYTGNALLQKTICTDYLTKKRKTNEGEAPQYYIKNGHPKIISQDLYKKAQLCLKKKNENRFASNDKPYSKRIKCINSKYWFRTKRNNGVEYWYCGRKCQNLSCPGMKLTISEIEKILQTITELILDSINLVEQFLTQINNTNLKRKEYILKDIQEIEQHFGDCVQSAERLAELDEIVSSYDKLSDAVNNHQIGAYLLSFNVNVFSLNIFDYAVIDKNNHSIIVHLNSTKKLLDVDWSNHQ